MTNEGVRGKTGQIPTDSDSDSDSGGKTRSSVQELKKNKKNEESPINIFLRKELYGYFKLL